MARDARFPPEIVRPSAPYSPVVRSGDHVFTAGQVAFGATGGLVEGGVEEQTAQALANVEACLAAVGCTLASVVKVSVFLADLADFDAFNEVYREAFDEPYPARTTVQAGLPTGIRVELDAVARIPAS